MSTPDPRERGLDPAHILSVASQAIRPGHGDVSRAVPADGGLRLLLSSRLATHDAAPALSRLGYEVTRVDGTGHRELLVTGWSTGALEARLVAMRAVMQRLAEEPGLTAAAVIDRARRPPVQPSGSPEPSPLADARSRLRSWVGACSGIHVPRDPAVVPADAGQAMRLRLATSLEGVIDDLAERQLRVARHAMALFRGLRQQVPEEQAKAAAIRRASVIFHLRPSPAADAPAPARPPAPSADRSFRADAISDAINRLSGPAARPAGGHSPAPRPGPHR